MLFGTVNELDFRDEVNPIIGTDTLSNTFSLMLVADFSLINTRTYEVKVAFSATGEGQDVRVVTRGSRCSSELRQGCIGSIQKLGN